MRRVAWIALAVLALVVAWAALQSAPVLHPAPADPVEVAVAERAPAPEGAPPARAARRPEADVPEAAPLPGSAVRAVLSSAIDEYLPSLKLSDTELDALADAVMRLRAARRELAGLSLTVENAQRHRELRDEIVRALSDFEYVARMSASDFTQRVQPGIGIDTWTGDSEDEHEVVLRPLRPAPQ